VPYLLPDSETDTSVTTSTYNVVMPVVSIRISDDPLHERLRSTAKRQRLAISALAERLIDEGLRSEAHPLVVFRAGPTGRRPLLIGGPEVADVVAALIRGDVPTARRHRRVAELLAISEAMVDAALAYYADFTDEIDAAIAERAERADEAEARWRRQRELLGR
jgi:hypothetical protein